MRYCLSSTQKEKAEDALYCGHTGIIKVRTQVGKIFLVLHYMLLYHNSIILIFL